MAWLFVNRSAICNNAAIIKYWNWTARNSFSAFQRNYQSSPSITGHQGGKSRIAFSRYRRCGFQSSACRRGKNSNYSISEKKQQRQLKKQKKKEIRAVQRQLQQQQQAIVSKTSKSSSSSSSWIPLSTLSRDHWVAICYRLPLWTVLMLLVTSEETNPVTVTVMVGPSMLPTIHPAGDIWLRTTPAWNRIVHFFNSWNTSTSSSGSESECFDRNNNIYQVGDIVGWWNDQEKRFGCKRIIGMEGDVVKIHGEFTHLYSDQNDLGIPNQGKRIINKDWYKNATAVVNQNAALTHSTVDPNLTITVPKNHVWLEGDLPPLSYDSRHYGPIHVKHIHGKLLFRLWPLSRNSIEGNHKQRPSPLSLNGKSLDVQYNLHRVPALVEEN